MRFVFKDPGSANDKTKQTQPREGGRGKCQESSRGGRARVVTERPTRVHTQRACARAHTTEALETKVSGEAVSPVTDPGGA